MTNTTMPIPRDTTVHYVIQSAASRFTVQAFASGLLSAFGHNPVIAIPSFSGEVRLSEEIEKSTLAMTIDATSLKVGTEMKDKDRVELEWQMHENVLESAGYPEIVYRCSRISASKTNEGQYWVALNGELTLHGVTKALTVPARVFVNGDSMRASGNFSLLQSDYDIQLVSVAGGALKVKDEVKFSFEITAQKQA
jgi:polyisoprenoid-binding protein YceI